MCIFKFYKQQTINNCIYNKNDSCQEPPVRDGFCSLHPRGIIQRQPLYSEFRTWFEQDPILTALENNNELSDNFLKFMYKSFYNIICKLKLSRDIFELGPNELVISHANKKKGSENFSRIQYMNVSIDIQNLLDEYYNILTVTPKTLLETQNHPNYRKFYFS